MKCNLCVTEVEGEHKIIPQSSGAMLQQPLCYCNSLLNALHIIMLHRISNTTNDMGICMYTYVHCHCQEPL